jgi:hypothetical protein
MPITVSRCGPTPRELVSFSRVGPPDELRKVFFSGQIRRNWGQHHFADAKGVTADYQ